jgi:adenylate cyclase
VGREIERKFLVAGDGWRSAVVAADELRQGYLCIDPERTVRVRLAGERAFLTIKGRAHGASRAEFEYPIRVADVSELLQMCLTPLVEKTRHRVLFGGRTWEVDVFAGANRGLVLAEVELEAPDAPVDLPPWLGAEVTDDHRYANANLAARPFTTW